MRYASPRLINIHHLGPKGDRNISGTCSACGVTLLAWLEDSEPTGRALIDKFEMIFRKHVDECHAHLARLQETPDPKLRPRHARKGPADLLCIAAQ